MIVTLGLDTLWISSVADGADRIELVSLDAFADSGSVDVDVRPMASGRIRAFRSRTRKRDYTASCTLATPEEVAWLNAHLGAHLCFRARFIDGRLYGLYSALNIMPYAGNDLSRLDFRVTEVTHSEAV